MSNKGPSDRVAALLEGAEREMPGNDPPYVGPVMNEDVTQDVRSLCKVMILCTRAIVETLREVQAEVKSVGLGG